MDFFLSSYQHFTKRASTSAEKISVLWSPVNYPADYWRDDKFPVKDLENNTEHIE